MFETRKNDISNYRTKSTGFRDTLKSQRKKLFMGKNGLDVTDFKSLTRTVPSIINSDYKDLASELNQLIDKGEKSYTNIKLLSKKLIKSLDEVNDTLWRISHEYDQLKKFTQHYNNKTKICKLTDLEDLYGSIQNTFRKWGDATSQRVKLIKDNLYTPYKFAKHEWESLRNLLQVRQDLARDYYNGWKELEDKRTYALSRGDINKYGLDDRIFKEIGTNELMNNKELTKRLMFSEDSADLKRMQNVFGYVNTKLLQETQRMTWQKTNYI